MDTTKMTGLEIMQAMLQGSFPHPPMAETIPLRLLDVKHGEVRFAARADQRHLNPMGGVHGGFAATVLDSVTGCAVHTALEAGVGYGTIDLGVKMIRPVPEDVELEAVGWLINLSRNIAVAEGTLADMDGKLYAHATCTCSIIRPSAG